MKYITNRIVFALIMLLPSTLAFGNTDTTRVEYIHPHIHSTPLLSSAVQTMQSDEYWEEVSGKQLQHGITLYAGKDALVRLAPMVSYQSGARYSSEDLELENIVLSDANKQVQMSPLAAQAEMELAGFRDGSVALTVNNRGDAPFVVKSLQSLQPDARYLVHVKEKNSPFKLSVSADKSVTEGENRLLLDAQIDGNKMMPLATTAKLIAPDGTLHNAFYNGVGISFDFQPANVGAINGFYEVQLTGIINVENRLVKRSIKVPFINKKMTASFVKQKAHISKNRMFVDVLVNEEGRYNVKATLRGKNAAGDWQLLQTGEVAQWLSNNQSLMLPFDLAKFSDFTELSIVNVSLVDQSRLIALESVPTLETL